MTARLRDCMPLLDRLCYLGWRLTRRTTPISVRLHQGIRVRIRPWPAMDIAMAHEVFVLNVYDPPDGVHLRPDSVRRAVDLGANIGCTCLLWLARYPKACVEAFEPHPTYAALLRQNLALNGWGDRVKLHEAAAGTAEGTMFLTDAEAFSHVVAEAGRDRVPDAMAAFLEADGRGGISAEPRERLPIRVKDAFVALREEPIDLLKIDIEGGEHALLEDARFATLPVRVLVMEWHDTEEHPDGQVHVRERLASCGYHIVSHLDCISGNGQWSTGVIWAVRVAGEN